MIFIEDKGGRRKGVGEKEVCRKKEGSLYVTSVL